MYDEPGHFGGGLQCPLCFGFGAIAPEDFGALEAMLCPLCDAMGTVEASVLIPEE